MYCRVYENHFGSEKVIISYEWNPEDVYGVNHESEIYSLIDGHQIAPKFLAHVTENSSGGDADSERVIGFMVEKISNARRATLDDLQACKEVLARLHALGIAFGPLRPEYLLIMNSENGTRPGTIALLQAFGGSYQTSDQSILDVEMESLEPMFQRAAAEPEQEQGFSLSIELSERISAINLRDNGFTSTCA